MTRQVSARAEAVRLLILGAGLVFAAPAGAQPCLQPICSAVLDCAEGVPRCAPGGCVCQLACNQDSDCTGAEMCDDLGLCVPRVPRPAPEPELPPECTANRDCDDRHPCNGEEVCDMSVCRRGPRPCPSGPLSLMGCVVDPPGSECFHCEVIASWAVRPLEGEIEVAEEPVTLPPGVGPDRETRPIPPPSGSGKGSGFRARGVLRAPLAAKAPLDLASGRLRVVLADQKGRILFDQAIAPGAWTGTLERGYALSGPAGLIRSLRIAPRGGRGEYLVDIEGIALDPALAKRFGREGRPVLAFTLEWKDAASTVAVAELGDCGRPRGRGRAPQALRCKSKGYAAHGTR